MEILNENTDKLRKMLSSLDESGENLEKVFRKKKGSNSYEKFLNNKEVCELFYISERALQE